MARHFYYLALRKRAHAKGVALLEILIALGISAILFAVGIPQFQTIVTDTRISSSVNQFIAANAFARAEAIKRGRLVTICRAVKADSGTDSCSKADTETRQGNDWGAGWLIFVEGDSSVARIGVIDGEDEILIRQAELATHTEGSSSFQRITYTSMGEPLNLRGGNVKFHADGQSRRVLCFARTGRIRVMRDVDTCSG